MPWRAGVLRIWFCPMRQVELSAGGPGLAADPITHRWQKKEFLTGLIREKAGELAARSENTPASFLKR